MKKIYLIGGTMGVGKTTICKRLKLDLNNSIFLDGDWCWDANPFQVNDETRKMVMENICFLLNQFIKCSIYENIIFCWVMHKQSIIDDILNNIDKENCEVKVISLICDADTLRKRLLKDVRLGIRDEEIIDRSIERIDLYNDLDTIKINTNGRDIGSIIEDIKKL